MQNIRGDVIWALRGQGGGLTVVEISMKISGTRGQRYPETKIQNVLDVLAKAGQVEKSDATGRVLYRWVAASH